MKIGNVFITKPRSKQTVLPLKIDECFHVDDPNTMALLARQIRVWIAGHDNAIFICIGTDRATGDCLGPYVGQLLTQYGLGDKVFGTLKDPLHAVNLEERLASVKGSLIVAIDACLGPSENIGHIYFRNGPLLPGSGLNKKLPSVGDYHIFGVINVGGVMEYMVLQNTHFYLVYRIAHIIAGAIAEAMGVTSVSEIATVKW